MVSYSSRAPFAAPSSLGETLACLPTYRALQMIACSAQQHRCYTSSNGRKSTTSSSLFLVTAVQRSARRAVGRLRHSWPLAGRQRVHNHQTKMQSIIWLCFGVLNAGDPVYALTPMKTQLSLTGRADLAVGRVDKLGATGADTRRTIVSHWSIL